MTAIGELPPFETLEASGAGGPSRSFVTWRLGVPIPPGTPWLERCARFARRDYRRTLFAAAAFRSASREPARMFHIA
jgi:hypothetical protein